MLTIKELKSLLVQNEMLLVECLRDKSYSSAQRLHELTVHRAILKDTLIEAYEKLSQNETI